MASRSAADVIGRERWLQVRAPFERARPLPRIAYTSEDVFRLERERLFARTWVAVAFAHDVEGAGDVVPVEVAGLPAIVVRGGDGKARAFHNACRHRGTRLVRERKSGLGAITCSSHGWTYDFDGRLRAAPLFDGTRDGRPACLDGSDLGLVPLPCGEFHGLVFVNAAANAPPLDAHVRPVVELWANIDRTRLTPDRTTAAAWDGEIRANWKFCLEAALENYHEPYVHRLPARVDAHRRRFKNHERPPLYGFSAPIEERTRELLALVPPFPYAGDEDARTTEVAVLYPNVMLSQFGSHFRTTFFAPVAVDRTLYRQAHFYHGDEAANGAATREARRRLTLRWLQIRAEDNAFEETLQAGRASPASDDVVYSPHWERPLWVFHNRVLADLELDDG